MPRPLDSQPCDPSASASSNVDPRRRGAVAVIERSGALLVIRRSQIVVAPGAFCFPGGGIEPGESEEEALVRELREELQVEVRPLRRLWSSVTPWNVELAWWQADLAAEAIPRPSPAEVESVHWYTLAEMAELPSLLESNRQFLSAIERSEIVLDTKA
ncbi:MAG TPA: NUDIX domain-containing protein [Pirellulales bacterium]|nr:NUDIX domain-containing protein [Pirellulales bacterium]